MVDAPRLENYLDEESREHFARLKELLDAAGIAYTVNPALVRGSIITAKPFSSGLPTASAPKEPSVRAVDTMAW